MASTFSGSSYLQDLDSGIPTDTSYALGAGGAAFSVSIWFRTSDTESNMCLLSIANKDETGSYFSFELYEGKCSVEIKGGGGTARCTTTTSYTADTWQNLIVTSSGGSQRTIYLNGAGSASETTAAIPDNIDSHAIAVLAHTSLSRYFTGTIGHIAAWPGVVLSAGEIASLAAKTDPFNVQFGNLQYSTPLTDYVIGYGEVGIFHVPDLGPLSKKEGTVSAWTGEALGLTFTPPSYASPLLFWCWDNPRGLMLEYPDTFRAVSRPRNDSHAIERWDWDTYIWNERAGLNEEGRSRGWLLQSFGAELPTSKGAAYSYPTPFTDTMYAVEYENGYLSVVDDRWNGMTLKWDTGTELSEQEFVIESSTFIPNTQRTLFTFTTSFGAAVPAPGDRFTILDSAIDNITTEAGRTFWAATIRDELLPRMSIRDEGVTPSAVLFDTEGLEGLGVYSDRLFDGISWDGVADNPASHSSIYQSIQSYYMGDARYWEREAGGELEDEPLEKVMPTGNYANQLAAYWSDWSIYNPVPYRPGYINSPTSSPTAGRGMLHTRSVVSEDVGYMVEGATVWPWLQTTGCFPVRPTPQHYHLRASWRANLMVLLDELPTIDTIILWFEADPVIPTSVLNQMVSVLLELDLIDMPEEPINPEGRTQFSSRNGPWFLRQRP
jgi:hypothetical protein